jgi:hypothetical protein
MSGVERYLKEYEKYKHVELEADVVYLKKSKTSERVLLLEINLEKNTAQVKNIRTENIQHKTLHWCRKNLIKE